MHKLLQKKPFRLVSIFLLLLISSLTAKSQLNPFYGLEASYNLPLSGVGIGLRSELHLTPRVSVVPNVSYFPDFNDVHELLAGANLQYSFLVLPRVNGPLKTELIRFRTYGFAGGYYNRWLNYAPTSSNLKETNFIPTVGIGVSNGSIAYRTFGEFSYNALANEGTIKFGVMVSPFGIKWNRRNSCPGL